jgi:hypothetical protein
MKDNGLIMMGDLPREMMVFFKKIISLLWVTYPEEKKSGLIVMSDLPG